MSPREADCFLHVLNIGGLGYDRGAAVNHRVVDGAGFVVACVAGAQDAAAAIDALREVTQK